MARLQTIVDLIESRDNFVLRVLDAPLMYSVQVAFAAERWRRAHGQAEALPGVREGPDVHAVARESERKADLRRRQG